MPDLIKVQFNEVLTQIQHAKQHAYQQLNSTLIELYWNVGKYISEQVKNANWGKGVVTELANFIAQQDREIKGFGDKNLWRMKQFYETYAEDEKLATLWRVLSWSHNRCIMSLKTAEEREFYLRLCQQHQYNEFYQLLEKKDQ